jgi:hypothetical protein
MADENNVSDGRPAGILLSQNASDKIGFYGTTPIVQGTTAAAGTDAATVQTLVNAIKVYLDASGQIA